MRSLKGKSVLITGGTGSIGSAIAKRLLEEDEVKKVTVFSRDEMKQWEMEKQLPFSKLGCVLGDVRDNERVQEAIAGHEIVIHAAALKQVPKGESNPSEFLKTNVIGTQNLLKAAKSLSPEVFIFLSTDKAVTPTSNYGSGKLTAEKMVTRANENSLTRFITIRLGNVMGTRGTVVPKFLEDRKTGVLSVTDPDCTRFHMTIAESVDHILYAVTNGLGGEVIVPKLKAFRLSDLALAVDESCEVRVIGLRKGERKHELLLAENELKNTLENECYYIVYPDFNEADPHRYIQHYHGKLVNIHLCNSSDKVEQLAVEELRELIFTVTKSVV